MNGVKFSALRRIRHVRPAFVHLRLHSEFSIVDGTVRIDEAIDAAAADAMPALAIGDLANAVRTRQVLPRGRGAGVEADTRLRRLADRTTPSATSRFALLLVASRTRLSEAHRLADPRVSQQSRIVVAQN